MQLNFSEPFGAKLETSCPLTLKSLRVSVLKTRTFSYGTTGLLSKSGNFTLTRAKPRSKSVTVPTSSFTAIPSQTPHCIQVPRLDCLLGSKAKSNSSLDYL